MKTFFKSCLAAILFLLFYSHTAFAQTDWVINNFHSDITIQSDGTVRIDEAIDVDFNNLEKHGIYRDIPVVYEDNNGKKTYTKISVNLVTQDGKQASYKLINNGNNLRIRIGDPATTINEIHYYEITYTATGVLRSFEDHDELYWNVTGNDWEADIETASAIVTLPKDGIAKTACFEGYTGYTNPCTITKQTPSEVTFTATRNLPPSQGLTVVVGYTKGMVPILTVEPPKKISDDFSNPLTPAAFFLGLFAGLGAITWLWMKNGRDFWYRTRKILDPNAREELKPIAAHEAIVVEFTPPENLRPAEIGVLMDEKADTLDITATIIDLANRGFLTIKEIEKKWLFGSKDYELKKTVIPSEVEGSSPNRKLLPYEELLLDRLFETGDTIKISSLKTKFYDDLAEVKKQLYIDIMKKKLFIENPESRRTKYLAMGFGVFALGFACIFVAFPLVSGIMLAFGLGTFISGLVWMASSRHMPRRSAVGRELYQRVKGYRLFIGGAEKYRQQFYEKKNLFNEVLPYSIVFGLTGKFAKAMKEMGIKPTQPTWYTGTHVFVPPVFASDVDSFSRSLSTTIASTPSKSGGFSGGSSGGGFGGGGGGSW
jgi:uncharacterized membrane protein